ncbi:Ig-like domain-containing protein, partial [Aquabacterium sp. A7-Y]|uniref:Ig-like domain-containing protein n=1 Tax=Aquabacterium sp. A7-Y TaxID=1349605 RepID=UPI00223CAA50
MKKTYRLRIVARDQQVRELSLDSLALLVAAPGAKYTVIDTATQAPAQDLVLKRQGKALLIEGAEGPVAQIDGFYDNDKAVAFEVPAERAGGEPVLITAADAGPDGSGIVWQAGQGTSEAGAASVDPLWTAAAVGLGVLGVAAGGGGGGGGGRPAPAPSQDTSFANAVEVTVVGGPVLDSHALQVAIYGADGTLLDVAELDANGHITVDVGEYRGVIIAKVATDADAVADYLDEATGAGKDLDVDLYAMGVIEGSNETLSLNLNVVSTLAYLKALESAGVDPLAGSGTLDTAVVASTNQAIADLFGLPALHGTDIVTINGDTSYNAGDGVSAAEKYGEVLAALSGADANQGGSTAQTLADLVAGVTLASGSGGVTAQLDDAAFQMINRGADRVDQAAGTDTLGTVSGDTNPSILGLSLASTGQVPGSSLNAGDTVLVSLRVSEPVMVTGVPRLALDLGGQPVEATYAGGSGTGTLTFSYTVQAGQTDADGLSIPADALVLAGGSIRAADDGQALILTHASLEPQPGYKVDTTAPGVTLTGALDDVGLLTGNLVAGGSTDDTSLLLSGSCEAGATVQVYDGSTLLGTAVVSGTGWTYAAPVLDGGHHQFHVVATDAAGNRSAPSPMVAITGDTSAPTVHATSLSLSEDSGVSPSDFITRHASQTLSATLSAPLGAGESLHGSQDGGATWTELTGMVDGTVLTWTGMTLRPGSQTIQLRVDDAAGNRGPVSSQTCLLDTASPQAQLAGAVDNVGNLTGPLASGQATDDSALVLSGSCEPGSTVQVHDGSTLLGTATVSGTSWTYTATVVNGGTHQFHVTETDVAGNTSAPSSVLTVVGDTVAPELTLLAATDDAGTITGPVSNGQASDDSTLLLSGSCEAGATVLVYDGSMLLGTATVNGTSWSYSATVTDATQHQFRATATDAAGNTSAPTADIVVVGDMTAP